MSIKTSKPQLPHSGSLSTRIEQFIGTSEGQPQRKKIVDTVTNQRYVKFLLELLESERNEVKAMAGSLGVTMNEFILEAIREKMEKYNKD